VHAPSSAIALAVQAAHEELTRRLAAMTPQDRARAEAAIKALEEQSARIRARLLADPIPTTNIADFRAWQRRQAEVIPLAERAPEVLKITELEPYDGTFVGKVINRDNTVTQYLDITYWRQRVVVVQADIPHLFAYFDRARRRNNCIIRGAPTNLDRQPTLRQLAGIYGREDRGDHGFDDIPTKLLSFDFDGVLIKWLDNPERAVRALVASLGDSWVETSFVWFLSSTCGFEYEETGRIIIVNGKRKKEKRWTGRIIDGMLRVRITFITERALSSAEATALTHIVKATCPAVDKSTCHTVQANYITRPYWTAHPGADPLDGILTIGWVKGKRDRLEVPEHLEQNIRWARAQGHGASIPNHPDAETAVRAIGSDGSLREHMKAAVVCLLRANPAPDVVSWLDHAKTIADKLALMLEEYREEIEKTLASHPRKRQWIEIEDYLNGMDDWALWCLNRPDFLRRRKKTIKLGKAAQFRKFNTGISRTGITARVARMFTHAYATVIATNIRQDAEDATAERARKWRKHLKSLDLKSQVCPRCNKTTAGGMYSVLIDRKRNAWMHMECFNAGLEEFTE
jgi:hypothetical protein